MRPLYTIRRARKDDTLYGPTHGADIDSVTLCDQEVDDNFWITSNAFDGDITCKKCLRELQSYPTLEDRRKHGG